MGGLASSVGEEDFDLDFSSCFLSVSIKLLVANSATK